MTRELPPFLNDLLNAPPRAGEGVHAWIFRVARQLHAHLPGDGNRHFARKPSARLRASRTAPEIASAVKNSLACAWQPRGTRVPVQSVSKWPKVNQEQLAAIIRDNGGLCRLVGTSPDKIEDNAAHTEEIINRLFPGNPLLCCGKYVKKPDGESYTDFDTKPRDDWRGQISTLELIVPSPMSAVTG